MSILPFDRTCHTDDMTVAAEYNGIVAIFKVIETEKAVLAGAIQDRNRHYPEQLRADYETNMKTIHGRNHDKLMNLSVATKTMILT